MEFTFESLSLRDKTFTLLRDLIHERLGIFFENDKQQALADKLSALLVERGFDSFLDYYYLLKYDQEGESEWDRVMDALSVQETYFYRELDQIRAVADVLAPRHFRSFPDEPLTIWCAACASGEEPLSLAMALTEAGWFERGPIRIVASDGSAAALAAARRGIYRDWSFRGLPAALAEKYFQPVPGGRRIADELHRRVTFLQLNLMDLETIREPARSRIVFCRNVFIYFSEQAIRRVAGFFHQQMPAPGYLFVGAAESLLRICPEFQLETIEKAFVYIKKSSKLEEANTEG